MSHPSLKSHYRCILYLKDEGERSLLQPGTRLYGPFVPSTGTVFMTPYPPPSKSFPVVAVIREPTVRRPRHNGLLTVFTNDQLLMTEGVLNNRQVELPIETVYMAASYARTPFSSSEMGTLQGKTVTIIGVGTGGGKIAAELARADIGHLKLCDPDRMDFPNISRHEGDLLDVGKPKTQVVAERVYRINPAIRIETYFEDIFRRPPNEIKEILNSHLVVAATDKTAKQLLLNELTLRLKIPCVFGGCYEEALGGEVLYTLPGEKMPCLACLCAGLEQPQRSAKIDYSTATGPEDYQGEPGLHAAIDFVTCTEVLMCLGILLREVPTSKLAKLIDPRFNFILIGGALGAGFYRFRKPFDIFFQPLKGPRKNCPVCGDNRGLLRDVSNSQEYVEGQDAHVRTEDK